MEVTLRNALFMKLPKVALKCNPAIETNVGKTVPTPSPARSALGVGASPMYKYNSSAFLFDHINEGRITARGLKSGEIYIEYTRSSGYKLYVILEPTAQTFIYEREKGDTTPVPESSWANFYAYAVGVAPEKFAAVSTSVAPIISRSFTEALGTMKSTGAPDATQALYFCDSIYFYTGMLAKKYVTVEEGNVRELVELSNKRGALKEFQTLKDNNYSYPISITDAEAYTPTKGEPSKELKKASFLEKCKTGEFFVPYTWDTESSDHIQPVTFLDGYVPDVNFEHMVRKIFKRFSRTISTLDAGGAPLAEDYINMIFTGKPGTGKTTLAFALSAALHIPVYSVAMSHNTEEDFAQGVTVIVDGKPSFQETDFLKAFTKGGLVVCEEINLTNPSVVMGALGQALEYPFYVMRNGYERVSRHPLCMIVGTMNVGTAGSKPLNDALSNRFKLPYTLEDPSAEDFIRILEKRGDAKIAKYVFNAYDKIRNYLCSPSLGAADVAMRLSLRTCFGVMEEYEDGMDMKTAISSVFAGKIGEVSLELANQVKKEAIELLPAFK